MKAYFGTTSKEAIKYETEYRLVRNTLKNLGVTIQFDWLDSALTRMKANPSGKRAINRHVRDIINAINTSDFVVVEYTVPNFSSSHQIIHALHKRKPTLVMRLNKDNSFTDTYLEGMESDLLTVVDYTRDNAKNIIKNYIEFLGLDKKYKRYNLVLETKHNYFLEEQAIKQNKSKSEIVREALDKYILING